MPTAIVEDHLLDVHETDEPVAAVSFTTAESSLPQHDWPLQIALALSSTARWIVARGGGKWNETASEKLSTTEAVRHARTFGGSWIVPFGPLTLLLDADADDSALTLDLVTRMQDADLRPVVWSTGTPGHLGIAVRMRDRVELRHWEPRARLLPGVTVRTGWLTRAPLSPGKSGAVGELLEPLDPRDAITYLTKPPSPRPRRQHSSEALERILAELPGEDRSRQEERIMICAHWLDWTFDEYLRLLAKHPTGVGARRAERVAKRGEAAERRNDQRRWDRVGADVAAERRLRKATALATVAALPAPEDLPLPSRRVAARQLYAHLVQCAHDHGGPKVGESYRSAATALNRDWRTMARAARQLAEIGVVRVLPRTDEVISKKTGRRTRRSRANTQFELLVPGQVSRTPQRSSCTRGKAYEASRSLRRAARKQTTRSSSAPGCPVGWDHALRVHDLARRDGFGQAFVEVVTAMPVGQPTTVAALAEATGRHPQTVRTQLKLMSQYGLVERRSRTQWRLCAAPSLELFDQLAGLLGEPERPLLGRGAQRARRYAEQSANFRAACEGRPVGTAEVVMLAEPFTVDHGEDDLDGRDVERPRGLRAVVEFEAEPCEQDLALAAELEATELASWQEGWAA